MQMQKCRLHRDAGTRRYGNMGMCGFRDMGTCVYGDAEIWGQRYLAARRKRSSTVSGWFWRPLGCSRSWKVGMQRAWGDTSH